ncbi:FtsX-like permease family protein [Fimbriimonadia bacterium ATM]|nr:MAG: FtsX-like permease family protein [Armatimonadota bacterium]MBC6968585.1 hypothetical protein [Armatimonadota bacterium]MCE7898576.1 hypothetical protein [Armatimonadetes bacterium ATM1]MDL1928131.1 FtsX-like permease family protein [Fimbriimonadia bacterium ATM]RIJ98303.1 MAG: hypothetical protein DCC45_00620 [Armatimonadota bacterium]
MILQSFLIALDMLRLHKLRAVLTMLGVIIGVMSVTLIVMLSEGFRSYIDTEFRKLGADTMFMFYDPGMRMRGQTTGGAEGLTNDDLQVLEERAQTLDIVSGFVQPPGQPVRYGDIEMEGIEINGVDQWYAELNRMGTVEGRHISEGDVISRANVCVLGEDVKQKLFPSESPIGKRVSFKGISLEVIGVAEKIEVMGQSNAKDVYVPLTTVQDKWLGGDKLFVIMMRPKPGITVDTAMDDVWQIMMARSGNRPIYRLDSRESILTVFTGIILGAGVILGAIAALSLVVGGIGIMNIMLVSVTERTREIGLRKALGAQRAAILTQFLVESAVLSLTGGMIGMGMGWLIGIAVQAITKATGFLGGTGLMVAFPIWAALIAIVFSALVGMVFGIYPAWAAARLDPIVALRSE